MSKKIFLGGNNKVKKEKVELISKLFTIIILIIVTPLIVNANTNITINETSNNILDENLDSNEFSKNEYVNYTNSTNISNLVETTVMIPDKTNEEIDQDSDKENSDLDNNIITDKEDYSVVENDIFDVLREYKTNGIYVEESISNDFLSTINFNSIYTYYFNDNKMLECDTIKKSNEMIDTEEETEVDIIMKELLTNKNEKVYICIDNQNIIEDNDATKVYLNEDNTQRIILLNKTYFNTETMNEYHPSLTDFILKALLYTNDSGIEPLSSFATTGKSTSAQTVYFGPSTSEYAEIGSVGNGEKIWIIGMSHDWYHITYEIGTSKTYKTGYLNKSNVSNASGPDLYEENLTGGYRVANQRTDVKSYDLLGKGVVIGTIFETEGVTCLYDYGNSDGVRVAYVEFSTSKGTKRGYIENYKLNEPISYDENGHHCDTTVGYVKTNVNLSMGVGEGYVNSGMAVSKDEYVSILGKENNNLYIEYNTKTGRKRAFTTTDYVEPIRHYSNGVINWYPDLPVLYGQKTSNVGQTVFGTPSNQSGTIGSINAGEAVSVYMNHRFNDSNNVYSYIAYNTSNGKKSGYVPSNTLSEFKSVELPEFKEFPNVERTIMESAGDKDGNNKSYMAFYKAGNGNNKLYLVFNQHGWEDAYPGDGVELTRIAQAFLTSLTDGTHSDILEKWTVCVMCDANPNGILNGEDHGGIGRTVPFSGVDMNRAWPTNNWQPSSGIAKGKKNYTGSNPVQDCQELRNLKTLLEANAPDSNSESILIDVHGWDCEIFGDKSVGIYYDTADTFSTSQSGLPFYSVLYNHSFRNDGRSGGAGYIISWAYQKLKVKHTALLELPYPGDAGLDTNGKVKINKVATADDNNVQKYNYAGRFITGTLNLLNGFLNDNKE